MASHPTFSQVFRIISAWSMPFVPPKASVRTLNIPTTSSPALDLALASARSFRATLRILPRLLLLVRGSNFLPSTLRFSQTEMPPLSPSPSPFAQPGSCQYAKVKGVAGRHVIPISFSTLVFTHVSSIICSPFCGLEHQRVCNSDKR